MNQQKNTLRIGTFIGALVILVGSAIVLYQQYTSGQANIAQLENENRTLENRLQVLEEASQYVNSYVSAATSAIPESNAGYYSLNAVKNESQSLSLIIDNVSVKSVPQTDASMTHSEVSFEVEGTVDSVMTFTDRLFQVLPLVELVTLSNRTTNDTSSLARAQVVLKAVSKAFPTQLPVLSEALSGLSPEQRSLLEEIVRYQRPAAGSQPANNGETPNIEPAAVGRTNPFAESQIPSVIEDVEESEPTDAEVSEPVAE